MVDSLNVIDKKILFQLISTVKLPGEKGYYTHMVINTGTRTSDVSLARDLKKPVACVTQTWSDLPMQIKRASKQK